MIQEAINKIQDRVQKEVQLPEGWKFEKEGASKWYDNILILREKNNALYLEAISLVEENQGQRYGTKVLNIICEVADEYGIDIILEAYPLKECTGRDVFRLMRFYKKFGFEENDATRNDLANFFRWYRKYGRKAERTYSEVWQSDGAHEFAWQDPFWMVRWA